EAMAGYVTDMENTLRLADAVKDVQLNEQTERLRASAMKSRTAAEKLRGMVRTVAERLNDRVDHYAKAAAEEYEMTSRWLVIAALVSVLLGLSTGLMVGQFGIAKAIRSLVACIHRLA